MRYYLLAGLKIAVVTLLLSLVVLAVEFLWPISISATAVRCFIDGSLCLGTLSLILALAGFTVTCITALLALELVRECKRDWIREAREATYYARQAKLQDRIRGMKKVYQKYIIYPELKILKDYQRYS